MDPRLPTVTMMVGIQRGMSMALRQNSEELLDDNRALRAEADTTLRRTAVLREQARAACTPGRPTAGGRTG